MLLLTILSELIVAVTTPNDRLAILPVAVAESPAVAVPEGATRLPEAILADIPPSDTAKP